MLLAAFSDVHANRHALEAVLADVARHRPDHVVCLGDLVGYAAFRQSARETDPPAG